MISRFSISKILRNDKPIKKNGKCSIYLRVGIKGGQVKLPTKFEIEESEWDNIKKEPLNPDLKYLLNKEEALLYEKLKRTTEYEGRELSIELVKELHSEKAKLGNSSFLDSYLDFIERKKKENIEEITIKKYVGTYNVLKDFRSKILISDINLSFVKEFDKYLAKDRGNKSGGREKRHANLKTSILDMKRRGIIIENPYDIFKIVRSYSKPVYLTLDELIKLEKLKNDVRDSKFEWDVLNMYIFSCCTGFRISDILALKFNSIDFKNYTIDKIQRKTKQPVTAPLPTKARAIAHIYGKGTKLINTDKKIFPYNDNDKNKINLTIKALAKRAGINKNVHYHTARHTFATLLISNGIPLKKVSTFLGHKSTKETEIYIQYCLSDNLEDVKRVSEIFYQNKKEKENEKS